MIYLEKGQPLLDNPTLVVYDQTGYYNDGDPVICASAGLPEEPACRFEAKYIAYGGAVYSISDPEALLEEIKKMDPKTLFGKDTQQVAVDKAVSEIVPNESGITETPAAEVDMPTEEEPATTTPTETPVLDVASSTPEVSVPSSIEVPTTTPSVIETPSFDVSSTTPDVPVTEVASTTPDLVVPLPETPPLEVAPIIPE